MRYFFLFVFMYFIASMPHCKFISCLYGVYFLNQKLWFLILMARFIYTFAIYYKINQGIALMRCQRTCVQTFKSTARISPWFQFMITFWLTKPVSVLFNFYNLKREQISNTHLIYFYAEWKKYNSKLFVQIFSYIEDLYKDSSWNITNLVGISR